MSESIPTTKPTDLEPQNLQTDASNTLDRITSSSSSRLSLTSSYNSGDEAEDANAIKPLHSDNVTSRRVKRIRSIRDQIAEDNHSILLEEKAAKDDLEERLKREFSIEDALRATKLTSRVSSTHGDEEAADSKTQRTTTVEKVFTNASTGALDLPPDGGYGWVCVMCAFTMLFSTWGNNSAFGVYLAYYIDNDVFPGATRMDFAWIAGMIVFFAQVCSPFAMIADRMIGFKLTMSIACCTHFLGYILASFATQLWQLYVCQGCIVGISYSFIFVPACTIIPDWFLKKRAIASGVVCMGTGLGGLVYSLAINSMIQRTGDQRWSLRLVAILSTVTIATAIFFIKRRSVSQRQKINLHNLNANFHAMFNLRVLQNPRLWYISSWFTFALVGYNMTLFSYASSATALGFSQHQASILTAVVNAAQALGRPSVGIIADSLVGRVNYSFVLNLVVIIFIFGFWVSARSFTALIVCGACLGFTLGVGNVMNTVLIADAFAPEDFASAWSILNMVMGFFILFVEVIALALRDDRLSNPFFHAQLFAGCIFTLAIVFLVPLREWHIRNMLNKRLAATRKDQEAIEGRKMLGMEVDEVFQESTSVKIQNYNKLLSPTPQGWFKRALYPVKI